MPIKVMNNGKTEGGQGIANLVELGTAMTTGSLTKGKFYYVKAKAASSSVLPVKVGKPFQAASALTLAEGDVVYPVTMHFLGFAKDKSIDLSKNVVDTTTPTDYPYSSSVTLPTISKTGSISGNYEFATLDGALMKFLSQFNDIIFADGESYTELEPSNPVQIIAIDWLARAIRPEGPQEGEACKIDFIPCTVTQQSVSGSMGSAVTLSFNYQGQPKDDNGMMGALYTGYWFGPAA